MVREHEGEINVLFTSVGRRVELLRAFRRAYESLGLQGRIIATDIDPLAPALQVSDGRYIVPRVASPDYIPTLAEICRRERVSLAFPLIDPDIPVLAAHSADLMAVGTRVAVVSPEAAAIARDKWLTSRFFHRLGLTIPHSWLPDQVDPARIEYPVFIKPRQGSAGQSAFKINDARELAFFVDYVPDPVIQQYLPGPEITNDIICDLDGDVLSVISRRRIEVRWGEVAKGVTVYEPAITEACIAIARTLPAVGPITVQCMLKDGLPHFTEINARFGGGIPLGISAGADSPQWLLARAAGLNVEVPPLGSYRTGLYLTRFDDAYFLTEDERAQLASRHI